MEVFVLCNSLRKPENKEEKRMQEKKRKKKKEKKQQFVHLRGLCDC